MAITWPRTSPTWWGGDDGKGDGCEGFSLRAYSSPSHREGQASAHLSGQHHSAQDVGAFCGRAGDRGRQCAGQYHSCGKPRLQLYQVRWRAGEKELGSHLLGLEAPGSRI